ncbi:hypothetical protein WG908_06315 [Sphingobium sp. AN641]|uniref:hypothetical protein n=1 Tax=Sphingobium sp. AN641 TaxID=3133443 RepID=UPI0030BC8854
MSMTAAMSRASVITMPKVNKGRVRKSNSMEAMGNVSLTRMLLRGDAIPENVASVTKPSPEGGAPSPDAIMALVLSVLVQLPHDKQQAIHRTMQVASLNGNQGAATVLDNFARCLPGKNWEALS